MRRPHSQKLPGSKLAEDVWELRGMSFNMSPGAHATFRASQRGLPVRYEVNQHGLSETVNNIKNARHTKIQL